MDEKKFIEEITKLKISITPQILKDLFIYYQMLVKWNKKMNLTTIIFKKDVYLKHFYDSLTLVKIQDFNLPLSVCDIGSGAGFPGLVLKIVFPHLKVTLIESKTKKTLFLNSVINHLKLKKIKVVNSRVEEYVKTNLNVFDIVTMRAVGSIKSMLKYALLIIKNNGCFLVMKGKKEDEMEDIASLLSILNSKIDKVKRFNLPIENSRRHLIKIKKTSKFNQKTKKTL